MKFKDLKPKYQQLEIYVDKEKYSLLEVPQKTKFDIAKKVYGERKVLLIENHDFRETTEVLLENENQYKKRIEYEN